jgi:hypothetical protein
MYMKIVARMMGIGFSKDDPVFKVALIESPCFNRMYRLND